MPALPLALGRFRGDRSPPTLQDRLGTRPSQGGDSCGLPIEGLREAQDLSLWGEESRESGGLPDSEERRDDTGLSAAAAKPVRNPSRYAFQARHGLHARRIHLCFFGLEYSSAQAPPLSA